MYGILAHEWIPVLGHVYHARNTDTIADRRQVVGLSRKGNRVMVSYVATMKNGRADRIASYCNAFSFRNWTRLDDLEDGQSRDELADGQRLIHSDHPTLKRNDLEEVEASAAELLDRWMDRGYMKRPDQLEGESLVQELISWFVYHLIGLKDGLDEREE